MTTREARRAENVHIARLEANVHEVFRLRDGALSASDGHTTPGVRSLERMCARAQSLLAEAVRESDPARAARLDAMIASVR